MARRRMIDPNFWQSEDVSMLTIRQRLLLIGLFSNADDEGKLRGNPAFIRSIIFPYEDFTLTDITKDLDKIEDIGSIDQYIVDSSKYIRLINWLKFQRVDKPQKSVIPNPETHQNDSKNDSENESENDSVLKERKRKEVKREEEKEKGREMPAPDSNPHKDFIHNLINECKIQNYNLFDLDEIFSYIGMVDIEVIEAAIKKGYGKESLKYCISTLKGMIKDGKTKKEHLFVKPIPGQAPTHADRLKSGKPALHIVTDAPIQSLTVEEMEDIRNMARKLDGAS